MKKAILFISAFLTFVFVYAQDRWTVQLNSKTLLTAKAEDTLANVISITDIKKGSLVVTFTPGETNSKWGRRLAVYDIADNQLYSKEAFSISIPAASLKKWKTGHSQIKIYTWPISKDPRIKLKVRRVHLCTIKFE